MKNDNTPHFVTYNANTLEREFTFTPKEIIDISVTVGRGGDVSGYVELSGDRSESSTYISNLKSRQCYAKVGFGEVYPVVVDEVSAVDNNANVVKVKIMGFKQYAELIDVFPWNLANVEEKRFAQDAKNTLHYFYGYSYISLMASILDNIRRTLNTRGVNSNFLNYGFIYNSAIESSGANLENYSWRLNILSPTNLSQAVEDVLTNNSILLHVLTEQDLSAPFNFILQIESNYGVVTENVDSGKISNFEISLENEEKRPVILYGTSRDQLGQSTVTTKALYAGGNTDTLVYSFKNIGDVKTLNGNREQIVERKIVDYLNYKGRISFSTTEEFSVLNRVPLSIPDNYGDVNGLDDIFVSKKSIEGQIYTYDCIFNLDSTVEPKTDVQKAILSPIEEMNQKANNAASRKNQEGFR